jgi:plasmid maintenance system antidote protein VapI
MQAVFEKLRAAHGTHSAAARALGIEPSYYRALRHGRRPLTKRMEEFLRMKVSAL